MGYRLDIKKAETLYYGTKLYGYENEAQFESYKYLVNLGYFDGEEVFNYGCENSIIIEDDIMKNFLKLYAKDLVRFNKIEKEEDFLNLPEITDILNFQDYRIYVISWN